MDNDFLQSLRHSDDLLGSSVIWLRENPVSVTDCGSLHEEIKKALSSSPDLSEKWSSISPDFATCCFREVCGYEPHPHNEAFRAWIEEQGFSLSTIFPETTVDHLVPLDLSPESAWLEGMPDGQDLDRFDEQIQQLQAENPGGLIAGGYLEPRKLYTTSAYERQGANGLEYRSVHLGVDYWLPVGTPVHAVTDGVVVCATFQPDQKEYGGLVILRHQFEGKPFFTLYGHLSHRTVLSLREGDFLLGGNRIGELGPKEENGWWVPHLHFQFMLGMLDYQNDFPGVAYPSELAVWKSICPEPVFGS